MKVTDVINSLEEILAKEGDLEVRLDVADDHSLDVKSIFTAQIDWEEEGEAPQQCAFLSDYQGGGDE